MRSNKISIGVTAVLAMLAVTLLMTGTRAVAQEKVLYSFQPQEHVPYPSELTSDAAGNLYGTTLNGGPNGSGSVFELSPRPGGGWTEKRLFTFDQIENYAYGPSGGVVLDSAGNLYGTTMWGGKGGTYGGTVFELEPQSDGGWVGTVLHNFGEQAGDGILPESGLTLDAAGNLYGTTNEGGTAGLGTVFELSPQTDGTWTEAVLHSFTGADGEFPLATVTLDAARNLYGTTSQGGNSGGGTVFQLQPVAGGSAFSTLYNFVYNGEGGSGPRCTLTFDASGNLYGTTPAGGLAYNYGTVFELTPTGNGTWTDKVVHYFGHGQDGIAPYAGLITDASGNFYGTTTFGGANNTGTVFKLTRSASGGWTETTLHSFGHGKDGSVPVAGLIFNAAGNLYGTDWYGGAYDDGTVYEITP
jgi:uncharacterized repeat protein (TIGR03803 family)